MISVGERDGRKRLSVGRDMEELELEEGEACYYYDNNNGCEDDSIIDPDIALSYIDEKLQDVLGHFQKDFEGGVSAENLGPKFGGYGSFLPTYQRSPPEVHSNNRPRSPNSTHFEGGRQNSLVSSSTSISRSGATPTNSLLVPAARFPTKNPEINTCMPPTRAEDSTSICKTLKKPADSSDQKSLKLRIRVGSENLLTTNNAELYSGLGLDVSPSLSLDNSPTDSEGLSHDLQDAPDESPTSILQIMTTFPMHGSLLLSPLSDDLIHLLEKDRPWGKSGSKPVHRISTGTSVVMANGSDSTKGSRKILGEKKRKSYEKDAIGSGYSSGMQNCVGVPSKKEIDVNTLACEELVSKALKLPLLSNSFSNVSYPANHSKSIDNLTTNIKGMVNEESFDHTAKEDLELVSAAENDGMEKKSNGIISLSGGVLESEKTNHFEFPRKEGNKSREQADVSANTEHSKGRKTPNIDTAGVSKPSIGPKITSENEAGARLVKEQVSSGGKNKHKVTQIHDAPGKVLNDGLVTDSSLGHKIKKSSSRDTKTSKSDSKGFKNHLKVRDAYAELFGNLEAEEEDDKIGSEKTHSLEVLKDSDAIYENNQVECNNSVKVRSNASKVEKPCALTEHPRLGSNMKTVNGNELNPSHAPIAEGPVLKEDWVLCDKCQTWRLLPLGRDPESLPKKWHCKMLDWLPGMNRCGISEEDTTKALRALYQFPTAPASETQTNNQHEYTDRKLLGVASVDAFHSGLENRTLGIQVADASGKKKYGSKDSANESKQAGLSSSKINNCQGTPYNRSLNDSIQSPAGDKEHQKNFRQSSTSVKEKQRNKLKERKKLIGSISSDGGAKNAKMKNKPETSLDNSRAPKKVKRDDLYHDNEHWAFDTAEENAGHSSSNGMSQIVSMKDRHIYKYKDSKTLDKSPQIHNPVSSGDGSLHAGKCDSKDSSKKRRKGNGNHHSSRSFPGLGCNSQDSIGLLEETCENGRRKEKRARVSKSEVKDSSGNKDNNEGKDERVRNKDQQIGQYLDSTQSQQTIDAMDSSKRLLGSLPPSMAATSSSSKVSGSQRNKSNLQELRASPVESVSSSPLRIPTVDKFTSTRRNDCQDAGSLSLLSPRRSSDGENGGGSDQSGMIKKGRTLSAGHNGSLDCQEADLGHISCVKVSPNTAPSPVIVAHDENAAVEPLPQFDQYASKTQNSERGPDKGRRNDGLHCNTGTIMKKSGKGSSSKPKDKKDKNRNFRSDFDRCTVNESLDKMPSSSGEKLKAGQNKLHERTANHSDNNSLKDPTERLLNEGTKEEIHSKLADNNGRHVRLDIISGLDKEQALLPNRDDGRSSKKTASDKTNGDLTSGRGKSLLALPARSQNETAACLQSIPGSKKETTNLSVGGFEDDALRDKRGKKDQSLTRDQPSTRHSTPMFNKVRDLDAPSPARKDPSNQAAANALKEATNLKHLADRLKKDQSSGSSDSTNLYFQAALKFLTAAALFESSSTGSVKHNEMNQSGQIYSSTAKLCEFCAHEYERSKDMATAALAYKCMEVAYMRVIYSSHSNANRYRNELQAALQIFPPGESPSSSASDVDNLNNPSAVDKGGLAKGVGSPQVTGAHVMTTRNRSNFTRLLNFAQEVSFAMEASRKSRAAFAAANSKSGDEKYKEGILCVKRALDFNFQDMDGLLRLVRVAMEEINR